MNAMFENLHWTIVHWRSKDVDNTLKAFQLYLQTAIATEATASLNNFRFKYIFWKKRPTVLLCKWSRRLNSSWWSHHAWPCGLQRRRSTGDDWEGLSLPHERLLRSRLQEPCRTCQQDEGQVLGRSMGHSKKWN